MFDAAHCDMMEMMSLDDSDAQDSGLLAQHLNHLTPLRHQHDVVEQKVMMMML